MLVAFLFSTVLTVMAVCIAVAITRRRRREVCDLRRSVVVSGPKPNLEACVAQRRALKPLLSGARKNGYNIIEVYGRDIPMRNGKPLTTISNAQLRARLKLPSGFCTMCLGERAEQVITSRDPLSDKVLASFLDISLPQAPGALAPPRRRPQDERPGLHEPDSTERETHSQDDPPGPRRPVLKRHPRPERSAPQDMLDAPEQPGTSWGRVGVLR